MTARLDFAQLELHFVDQMQWRYELIRPLVLLAEARRPNARWKPTPIPIRSGPLPPLPRPGHARPVAQRYRSAPTRASTARAEACATRWIA